MSPAASAMLINQIAPLITGAVHKGAVKTVGCEDREELVQDCLASAAQMLDSAEQRGKVVTPGNITYYVLQSAKTGRRSTSASRTDALSPACQLDGRSSVRSMDAPVESSGGYECGSLHEIFEDRGEDPSLTAARRIDWIRVLPLLDDRSRSILCETSEGIPVNVIAERHKVSSPRIVQLKREIAAVIAEHFGNDILAIITGDTAWEKNIRSVREKEACRYERSWTR